MGVVCSECGSERVRCIENGVDVISHKFEPVNAEFKDRKGSWVMGDLYECLSCGRRFVTGLGDDSRVWKQK